MGKPVKMLPAVCGITVTIFSHRSRKPALRLFFLTMFPVAGTM
jgi:hypothetical protein